jgi:hypothetical protein
MPQRALAVAAPARLEVNLPAKALQVPQVVVTDQHDVAAAGAVATVGPAARNMRLTAEAEAAVAAGAGLHVDVRTILHVMILP